MKSFLFILIVILTHYGNRKDSEKELKCIDFKNGKFELINMEHNRKYIIERYADFQTEETFNLKSGEQIGPKRFDKINWKNDCEYNLKLDSIDKMDLYINSKGGINSKIINIEGNCATVRSTIEGTDVKRDSKMCKIK